VRKYYTSTLDYQLNQGRSGQRGSQPCLSLCKIAQALDVRSTLASAGASCRCSGGRAIAHQGAGTV